MCGIAGIIDLTGANRPRRTQATRMITLLAHRGPESTGLVDSTHATLAHARLSIIDLMGGIQPLPNENGSVWVTCNGEFFDYQQQQRQLIAQGHQLRTQSDSEIVVHLYEDMGCRAVEQVRGQFAFGVWDETRQRIWLVRDRMGIRPIFYTLHDGFLLFASEIKALLSAGVERVINPNAVAQAFTTWSPLPGQTLFADIYELPAGHQLVARVGSEEVRVEPYFELDMGGTDWKVRSTEEAVEQGREILAQAIETRLIADVPVGAYLSGGLDSSLVVALAQKMRSTPLHTFSLAFDDADYDESDFQQEAATALGTRHHVVQCSADEIRDALPATVWHSEMPLFRLSPVPMYLLSRFVHENGLKVVLTGEGADEFFGGYTIFREMLVRRFMARQPNSEVRPLLLKRLYSYLPELQRMPTNLLRAFFGRDLDQVDAPHFSHLVRWQNNARGLRLLSAEKQIILANHNPITEITDQLPHNFNAWHPLAKAQYIEATTFMSTYLLNAQGDRMAMAHAVEGRYPFLDERVIAFANQLPPNLKVRHLRGEKFLLKRMAQGLIPDSIVNRPKQPYRSPIHSLFAQRALPDYAQQLLSPTAVKRVGWFDADKVARLVGKTQSGRKLSESDQMTFVGVLTFHLFHHLFIEQFSVAGAFSAEPIDVRQHHFNPSARHLGSAGQISRQS